MVGKGDVILAIGDKNLLPWQWRQAVLLRKSTYTLTSQLNHEIFLGSHCLSSAEVPPGSGLEPESWDGDLIPIGTSMSYVCSRGRHFTHDFNQMAVVSTCIGGLNWTEPTEGWGVCTESKVKINQWTVSVARPTSAIFSQDLRESPTLC